MLSPISRYLYCISLLTLLILPLQKACGGSLIAIDHSKESNAEIIGDYVTVINPVVSLALIAFNKDFEGLKQFVYASALGTAITLTMKYSLNSADIFGYKIGKRPNGGKYNFPSGHSSWVFTSSQFVCRRYGGMFGVPMTALSIFTAYSRVQSRRHDIFAVLTGTLIGIISAEIFTTRLKSHEVKLSGYFNKDGAFIRFKYDF